MTEGTRIEYDDDVVEVLKKDSGEIVYEGLEDYEPMKNENWKFIITNREKRLGYYQFGEYIKYNKEKE